MTNKVTLTAAAMPNIEGMLARMKALGMVGHDYFDKDGEIVWCPCKRCTRKRGR